MKAATATYRNNVTRETYTLGFFYDHADNTPLGAAWDHVTTAAEMAGWNKFDIFVTSAK